MKIMLPSNLSRYTQKLFLLSLIVGIGVVMFVFLQLRNSYMYLDDFNKKYVPIHDLIHESIRQNNELVILAYQSVATGNPLFESQYHTLLSQFMKTTQASITMMPELDFDGMLDFARQTTTSLDGLYAQVFDLVHQGKQHEAELLMESDEHTKLRQDFETGWQQVTELMDAKIDDVLAAQRQRVQLAIIITLACLPIEIFLWVYFLWEFSRNQREHNDAVEELKTLEAQYATVVEYNNDGIAIIRDGIIQFLNEPLAKMLGFKKEEMDQQPLSKFVEPSFIPFIEQRLMAGNHHPDSSRHEFEMISKTGERVTVEEHSSSIVFDNQPASMMVIHDLRKAYALEKMRKEFVAIASHQLRTPIVGIKWFVEILLKNKKAKLTDEQRGYINEIYIGADRMAKLVDDLLDVSRLENGSSYEIVRHPEEVASIVDEALGDQRIFIEQRKVKIIVAPVCRAECVLEVDRHKIRQVFSNLINNAVKYSAVGQSVTIDCRKNKNEIIFSVIDHGVGIPAAQQSQVFERFFRGENIATKESGTGLGLYIVKNIVERHHGRIWFESTEGKGSTFYVALPL